MITVRQCRDDCCAVRVHSERRWWIHLPTGKITTQTFSGAVLVVSSTLQEPS